MRGYRPLGRRLLAAFAAVTLASVGLVTVTGTPASAVTGNCGSAEIELTETEQGIVPAMNVLVDVQLDAEHRDVFHAGMTGWWINQTTALDSGPLTSVAGTPYFESLQRYPYGVTATWARVVTNSGLIEVSFPLIEVITTGGICFGLFPRSSIFIDPADPSASLRVQVALNERTANDLAFVIDTTGSMGGSIDAVKASAVSIVNRLASQSSNFRVAVVQYNDPYAGVVSGFSSDVSTITAAINSLGASGGGDTPEFTYSGVMSALGLPWRDSANRSMIVIGDAAAKDPEPGTGYTMASVTAAVNQRRIQVGSGPTLASKATARSATTAAATTVSGAYYAGSIPIMSVPVGSDPAALTSFQGLSAGTLGTVYPAADSTGVVDAINRAVDRSTGTVLPPVTSWKQAVSWYGGTGTMTGVRRVSGYAYRAGVCDSTATPWHVFTFSLPSAVPTTKLRWWALDVTTDQALKTRYGSLLPAVGAYGQDYTAWLCMSGSAGSLPTGVTNVKAQLRMSW
ncbi:vWA domain-containing protein [Micromonospora siamensis]|uniref:von Willebrand factor type A domain-containing protein n=1 Tax=Micromonospora siamensis TaxID=299152 RepID=A0A1C5J0K9_9ACTN|nr:vWA domain-containing protein [Micromonospora siamensis]SCG63679.1 von Willebrand factor type A domain-containing protein [Micromonospora siamensis]